MQHFLANFGSIFTVATSCLSRMNKIDSGRDRVRLRLHRSALTAMAGEDVLGHVLDVARHGGTQVLSGPIPPPKIDGNFLLDDSVIAGISSLP